MCDALADVLPTPDAETVRIILAALTPSEQVAA